MKSTTVAGDIFYIMNQCMGKNGVFKVNLSTVALIYFFFFKIRQIIGNKFK